MKSVCDNIDSMIGVCTDNILFIFQKTFQHTMKEADFKRMFPNAPKEVFERGKAVRMIFFSVPIVFLTSIILYKRLFLGEQKKVQLGEILEDGSIRYFTPQEIEHHDKQSFFTRFFGQDKVDYEKVAKK